jgi:hypothetical protein
MAELSTMQMPADFDSEGRPQTVEAAEKAINQIRFDRGHVSDRDLRELSKTDPTFQEDYKRRAKNTQDVYARFTKVYVVSHRVNTD